MEKIKINNLTFAYPEGENVLSDINLNIKSGEFVVVCGPSGCGKTTLLRQLKTVLAPHGRKNGEIYFDGKLLEEIDLKEQASKIGFVLQSPENQLVTDKVWHELAFGLEGLGVAEPEIRRRVAEMASFFGLQELFHRNVNELSGGQKQLINLASVMAMKPSVLILDEPSSQLDPIAASDFTGVLAKINRELGTTIIITEHRLEEVFEICTRVIVMDEGKIISDGMPKQIGEQLKNSNHKMFMSMPAPMRIYAAVENDLECPVSVKEGADWLKAFAANNKLRELPKKEVFDISGKDLAVELDEVWFRYERDGKDILKGLSLKVAKGEFLAVLGGNGTGKSTLLSVISGINRAYRGKVIINGRPLEKQSALYKNLLGVLPQNPKALFLKKTVREDLIDLLKINDVPKDRHEKLIKNVAYVCRIGELLDRHPYDLSGGEVQRAALAKLLLLNPKILLLDEPTKGIDAEFKAEFAKILRELKEKGVTIILVSHDVEFCAEHADRCALIFDGEIAAIEDKNTFFKGNSFYTTSAGRMSLDWIPGAVTAGDVIYACGGEADDNSDVIYAYSDRTDFNSDVRKYDCDELFEDYPELPAAKEKVQDKLPLWRKIAGGICSFVAAVLFFIIIRKSTNLSGLFSDIGTSLNNYMTYLYAGFLVSLLVALTALGKSKNAHIENEQMEVGKRRLPKRTIVSVIICLLAIPVTIFIGAWYLGDRKFYFISLLIMLEAMLPFVAVFEGRKPQARELVITSVLCAIAVAGRMIFYMLPNFNPVMAVVIISGVAFGGETGFLVGAVTMLVSNIFAGQGPWTPWQMFAMGLTGLLAGVLFKKGLLLRNRLSLCIYGALAAVIIYGGIMNPASIIMWQPSPTKEMIFASYVTGFPFDLVHASAIVIFLWVASKPMLEKLDRVKVKYGVMER